MTATTWHLLATVTIWTCWGLLGVVWAAGAVYNAFRAPTIRVRSGIRWTWLLAAASMWVLLRLVPSADWRRISVRSHAMVLVGLLVLPGSTAFALWARAALGRMWSSGPLVREGHQLRTQGPYGITRHPIYTGILGMLIGTALLIGLGPWGLVIVLVIVGLEAKIHSEEQLMSKEFPVAYEQYRRRVPQLIPRLNLLRGQPFQ